MNIGGNEIFTLHLENDIDIDVHGDFGLYGTNLPFAMRNIDIGLLPTVLKYQRHFGIWNADLTLNLENFKELMSEIQDGLR